MQLTAYQGTVIALITLSLGAFYFVTSNLGNQLGERMTLLQLRMDRDRWFIGARPSARR